MHRSLSRPRVALTALVVVMVPLVAGCTAPGEGGPGNLGEPVEHGAVAGLSHVNEPSAAPPFEVETIDGETISLGDLNGKVVLLEFMGAGCTVCLRNLPHHKELYAEFQDDADFAFLALDAWRSEDESDLRAYRDRHDIGYPMAMAPSQTIQDYAVRGTPTQYFLDHEGRFHSFGGYVEYPSMSAEVSYLLEQIPGRAAAAQPSGNATG